MKKDFKIIWFDTLDSTNDEALRNLAAYDNLTVVAAADQTAGRGQRGNEWKVAPGQNLTFSVILKFAAGTGPEAARCAEATVEGESEAVSRDVAAWCAGTTVGGEPEAAIRGVAARRAEITLRGGTEGLCPPLRTADQFLLTKVSALSVIDLLRSHGIEARVKWPNDIYVGRRKVCGMLLENASAGGWLTRCIDGIGVNVNQRDFPPSLVNPTSMSLCAHRDFCVRELLEEFCGIFAERLTMALDGKAEALDEEYLDALYQRGVQCRYTDCATGMGFEGTISGVDRDGHLRMTLPDGSLRRFAFKEVSFIV